MNVAVKLDRVTRVVRSARACFAVRCACVILQKFSKLIFDRTNGTTNERDERHYRRRC